MASPDDIVVGNAAPVVPPRLRRLETWFRKVIREFQNPEKRPDLRFDNLTDLYQPTQLYGVAIREGRSYRIALLVTHLNDRKNGQVIVVWLRGLDALAEFAAIADRTFGTGDLKHQYSEDLSKFADPERRMGEILCISLANWVRGQTTPLLPPPPGVGAGSRSMIQTVPHGALWQVTCRGKPQSPGEFLNTLGRPKETPKLARKAQAAKRATAAQGMACRAFGAYNEPVIWFGEAPFPSVSDLILGVPRMHTDRLVVRGSVDGVEAFVYNTGLVVMLTPDHRAARLLLNQFFAVLARSGVPSLALPDSEMIQITNFDAESGGVRGSSMAVTRRNRLSQAHWEGSGLNLNRSFVVDESVAAKALTLADECATGPSISELALRFFDALTLKANENYTEAFVVAWSLIETQIQSIFNNIWGGLGFSSTRIRDMTRDWTASHNIDLLVAVGEIGSNEAAGLHTLRKQRNKIVHELQGASAEDARQCLEEASILIALPYLPDVTCKPASL